MTQDNDDVERLLRAAGRRVEPSPEVMLRLRAHAHQQWLAVVRKRTRVRYFAAAASVLALLGGVWLFVSLQPGQRVEIARIIHGGELLTVERRVDASDPELLAIGDRVTTTAAAGTLLAHLPGGVTTIRLDRDSSVQWTAADELRLIRGRLYVDSGRGGVSGGPLIIVAAGARVQHVGTQFTAALDRGKVVVGVRDGIVKIDANGASASLTRGELATITPAAGSGSATIVRGHLPTFGTHWRWADALAPRLPIEGRNLVEVLRALAYQSGLNLTFANEAVEAEALATILHGPALDMAPDAALRAILTTTSFAPTAAAGSTDRVVIVRR